MDLIRCPRCAKEIPDRSRFCRRCGCAVGWGLSAGFSPAWPRLAEVDWASERPVTLAGSGSGAGATKAAAPATLSRPRAGCGVRAAAAADRKKGGGGNGAWVASLMMGLAAFMFFSHVHRMATRPVKWERPATVVPGLRGFPADPAGARLTPPPLPTTPVPRSYPRPLSSDAMDWRVSPPVVTPPQPPEVRVMPPMLESRVKKLERAYREWNGREEGDGVDEGSRPRGR